MADFYNLDVRSPSKLTADQIDRKIATKCVYQEKATGRQSKMRGTGKYFLEAERRYGINAGFLVAIAAKESGWGTSSFAHKYNSFFGFGAYNSDPENTKKYGAGTVEAGIYKSASAIRATYVDGYKKRTIRQFQTPPYAYAQLDNGSPNPNWAPDVASIWAYIQGQPNTGILEPSGGGYDSIDGAGIFDRYWTWHKYTLIKGDNLSVIATKFKTTVAFLEKWNAIRSSDILNPGWQIRVYPKYTVKEGDTLDEIASWFHTTTDTLRKLNPSLGQIKPGVEIRLPDTVIDDKPPTSYSQVNRDIPLGDGRFAQRLPYQPVIGRPPHVENDEYPAHRTSQNPFTVRIGDVQLFIPPTSIKTNKEGSIDSEHVLRSQNEMMKKSGNATNVLELELYFADTDQINGYRVTGPNGKIYFMDGLRPLLAQFMKSPFLPIRNEFINERLKIYNVAFQDITIETDPDFDNVLIARLKLLECTIEPFTQYPDFFYDNMFMYPLFRWWYQQLLIEDDTRLSSRYLRPVPHGSMLGTCNFSVLDRDLVEQKIEELGVFAMGKVKTPDLSEMMTPWPIEGAVLENVVLSMSKTLKPLYMDDHEMPAFQDLGGIRKEFIMEFRCTNRAQVESFNQLFSHLEEMSRDFRHRFVSGYMNVDNEIVNMMGIYQAMIIAMDTETDPDYDDCFIVRLYCRGFDGTQKSVERLMGVNSMLNDIDSYFDVSENSANFIETKGSRVPSIIYDVAMEEALAFMELYPDLELPTYDDVNMILPVINKFRRSRGYEPLPVDQLSKPHEAVFVDPDFYLCYPDMRYVFEDLEVGDFGTQFINMMQNPNEYLDSAVAENERDLGWWLEGFDKEIMDKWSGNEFQIKYHKTKTMDVEFDGAPRVYTQEVGRYWNKENPVPTGKSLLHMMCHDMVLYSKRGRMVRAFPTYLILFVDEGQWVNGRRVWNKYYSYHAVHELTVTKDKNHPVDLAFIRLSNIYGAFDFSSQLTDPRSFAGQSYSIVDRVAKLFKNFYLTLDDKIIYERTQMADHLKLNQGARIHIRMGYGSAPAYLPISFNGQIATINDGDVLELVCQSDGVELTHVVSIDVGGELLNGENIHPESQNIFRQLLTSRESDFWYRITETQIFRNHQSAFGIEHFGYVEIGETDFWGGVGSYIVRKVFEIETRVNEYDVMKNIYRGTKKDAYTDTFLVFDQEPNIDINPFGKTAWDVMQTATLHTPEFVCYPHAHGFRSTLFHGMPHWPVKYGYRRKRDANGNPSGPPGKITSYEEMYKPFQQFHIIATGTDILANNIEVSSEQLYHIAVGVYMKGRGREAATTEAVYADRSIKQELQKTLVVDTIVHQNKFGPEWAWDVAYATLGSVNDLMVEISRLSGEYISAPLYKKILSWTRPDLSQEKINQVVDEAVKEANKDISEALDKESIYKSGRLQARGVAIGSLQRNFMEMYQGELIIFGDPAIKPWDIFHLADSHKYMFGTAGVGKVTHTMSMNTGFVTIIKPDLIVARSDGTQRNEFYSLLTKLGALITGHLMHRLMMTRAARMIANTFGSAGLWSLRKGAKAGEAVASLLAGEERVRLAKQALQSGSKNVLTGLKDLSTYAKWGTKTIKYLKGTLLLSVLLGWLGAKFEDWVRKEFDFNNCLFIYPLWKMNKPFVAGISGFKMIIPGYLEPEYLPMEEIERLDDPLKGIKSDEPFKPRATSTVVAPVDEMRLTSPFGYRSSSGTFHKGIDLDDIPGQILKTPCRAIADGVCMGTGYDPNGGNYVYLQVVINDTPYYLTYMHLHSISVKKGQKVKAGQQVGIIGNTGNSIYINRPGDISPKDRARGVGSHLHFEVTKGTYRARDPKDPNLLDPEKFLKSFGITMTRV